MAGRTHVLIHGAAHGGWCWREVAQILRASGCTVYTPTLTGLGERSHLLSFNPTLETFVEDVAQVIRNEELADVILTGHSFAGTVVSALADRMPCALRHLVYLDALLLQSGESSADRDPPKVEQYRRRAALAGGLAVPPNPPAQFGITDPAMSAWLERKLTAQPLQPYFDKLALAHPLGNGIAATYIACSDPLFAPLERSRELARRMGWRYLELATAHDAMMLKPRELADILMAIE